MKFTSLLSGQITQQCVAISFTYQTLTLVKDPNEMKFTSLLYGKTTQHKHTSTTFCKCVTRICMMMCALYTQLARIDVCICICQKEGKCKEGKCKRVCWNQTNLAPTFFERIPHVFGRPAGLFVVSRLVCNKLLFYQMTHLKEEGWKAASFTLRVPLLALLTEARILIIVFRFIMYRVQQL